MKKLLLIALFLSPFGHLISQNDSFTSITREVTKNLSEGNAVGLSALLVSKEVALNYFKTQLSADMPSEYSKVFVENIEDGYNSANANSNEKRFQQVIKKITENQILLEDLKYIPNDYESDTLEGRPIQVEVHLTHAAYKRIYFKVMNVEGSWYLFNALIQITH